MAILFPWKYFIEVPRRTVCYGCIFMWVMFLYAGPRGSLSSTVRYWESSSDLDLVTVDETGQVFVAGRNFVFKLDRFLNVVKNGTIPSGSCWSSSSGGGGCSTGVNSHAKIFEIVPDGGGMMLLCGSDRNGLCSTVEMESLNIKNLNSSNVINYAGGLRNVVGFFTSSLTDGGGVLYVANTYDRRPYNVSASAISARILRKSKDSSSLEFSFLHKNYSSTSSIEITMHQRSDYIVVYVYGFEYKGFTYFVTLQRPSLIHDTDYETRLVRVCQKDEAFLSYTEISIACKKSGTMREFYNIPLAAHLRTTGKELQGTLFIVFGKSERYGAEAVPSHGSGLCAYSMNEVVKVFTSAQRDCYQGTGRILPWIHPEEPRCRSDYDIATKITDNFCGSPINVGIGGRYMLQVATAFTTDTYLATSLKMMAVLNKTVAVIGTASGQVLKVIVDGTGRAPYSVTNVSASFSVRPDMEFDATEENIYVLSGKRISMVPLKTCGIYRDCSTCIMSGDPLNCGWCGDHCSSQRECNADWLTGHCPPVIHSFNPRSGPLEGGTVVTIHGRNFGNGTWPGSVATVKVANNFECLIEYRNSSFIICKTKSSSSPIDREFNVWVADPSKTTVNFEIRGTSTSSGYESFSYKVASVSKVVPRIGPVSGSTILSVFGSNLNIGSNLTVKVLGKPCNITEVRPTHILCLTPRFHRSNVDPLNETISTQGFIEVRIDDAVVTRDRYEFVYAEDPVIFSIFPNRSILSGGMNITVSGKNLNSVSHPRIFVNCLDEETMYSDDCESSTDGTQMICLSPNLTSVSPEFYPSPRLSAEMRFAMDGVEELWNFPSTHPMLSPIIYSVDPELHPILEDETREKDEQDVVLLKFTGLNLNLSATTNDYIITVGGLSCNVTQLTMTDLVCYLPENAALMDNDIVGAVGSLVFDLGQLQPRGKAASQGQIFSIGMPLLISTVIGSAVVVVACALWLRFFRHALFRRKRQIVPNVLYTGGSQMDLAANRGGEAAAWHNPVPNSYLSHSEAVRHRLAQQHSSCRTREPILDEESRRLLNDSNLLISRDCLLLLEIIGQGHFGCVFRGFLKVGAKDELEVAVKTLKSIHITDSIYMNPVDSKKFLDEALTMREFNHVHVLKLIGIIIDKEELPLVVLPFMRHGDLLSYLRNEQNSPTVRELMVFGKQIADGMNYLANLKFVHRDLAARNCMLDDNMNVKVADFGLSRDIYERDYYSSDDRKAKLPVKWMALESLEKGIYSTKTDVWSFGVVLWELMTRGVSPYPEVDNWDIIRYLKNGRRMPQPSYCPNSLYNVMLNCWNPDHSQRPTFDELAKTIHGIIEKMEGIQHLVGLSVTYINTDSPGASYLRPIDSRYSEEGAAAAFCRRDPLNYLSFESSQSTLV